MTKRYSKKIAGAVNAFLKEDDWKYSFDEGRGAFKFGLNLHGKLRAVDYHLLVHEGDYVVYALSPIGADPKDSGMLQQMAEFVCRANYGLHCGNFELDFSDGEIRYKCYVSCEGDALPTSEIIRESIYCPARMFDRYAPGILGILFQDKKAEEMVDECENVRKEVQELMEELRESGDGLHAALANAAEQLGISMDSDVEEDGNAFGKALAEAVKHVGLSDGNGEHSSEETASETEEPNAEALEVLSDLLRDLEDEDEDGEGDESGA